MNILFIIIVDILMLIKGLHESPNYVDYQTSNNYHIFRIFLKKSILSNSAL